MVTERTFTEIFLRYRRDPSLLGEFMAAVMTRARDELTVGIFSHPQFQPYRHRMPRCLHR